MTAADNVPSLARQGKPNNVLTPQALANRHASANNSVSTKLFSSA